jgi:tetratricopeptide (TPR) repeat protein
VDAHPRPRGWLLASLLAAAAFALYARTAGFPFVEFDDPGYVRDNPHVALGLTRECVRWAFTSAGYQYNWHPLTWLSHALDVELSGLDAGRHHLVNALLHAANAALLFLALFALTGRDWPSALAAALFALHPLRVESVAWVAQRKDVLAGTFFCLTLLLYARHARAPSRTRLACVALALAAGLMAKPTLVTVPLLLLLLDAWPLGRFSRDSLEPRGVARVTRPSSAPTHPGESRSGAFSYGRIPGNLLVEKLPLLALSLASIALTLAAQGAGGAFGVSIALRERIANAALAYVTYLRQALWPSGLAVLYPHPALAEPPRTQLVAGAGALLVLALLSWGALRARRARPWLAVGWGWFLVVLVPMIGLVQVGNQAHADRYAYLALIGPEIALAWSAAALVGARRWLVAPVLVGLAALALGSWRQLDHWRSSAALFTRALEVTEGNFVAHNNLGLVLAASDLDAALAHFEAAAAIRPAFFEAELNAGKAHLAKGEVAPARGAFERAVAARPASGEAHLHLALALARGADFERADEELSRALECQPDLAGDARARELGLRLAQRLEGG